MTRRDFVKMAAGTAVGLCGARRGGAQEDTPVNLLIIHTDEHHYRTLGCYRDQEPESRRLSWGPLTSETPNIDWIAAQGALCTRFYATTPVCSPSRAAFVSGQYPHRTPVNTNNIPMSDEVVTFAHILQRHGYSTGYAGKWHLDGTGKPQWQPQRNFGFADNRYMFNRGHWKQMEDTPAGPRVHSRNANGNPNYSVDGADGTTFTTDFLTTTAIDFLKQHHERPFCYMLSYPDPHGPNTVRAPYDIMYDPALIQPPASFNAEGSNLPAWARRPANATFPKPGMARYFGMVKCIDDNVGRLLAALRQLGILDRTIVMFTADHGDLCGEHGRHNKGNAFEGSARIPFVIRYPGVIAPGTVLSQALGCVDFLPTILALMGVPTAGREEGRDASALFRGQAPGAWRDVVFMRSTGDPGRWLAAVSSRHKFILARNDMPCLFDLDEDPDELNNVFTDERYRAVVRELAVALRDYCEQYGEPLAADSGIQADLEWAAEGTGPYPRAAG